MYHNEDLAKLLLRWAAGGLMLFHGVHKLIHGHDFIRQKLSEAGLPEIMALGVPLGEVVAPILMMVGLLTRISSLVVAFTMVMSIYLVFGGGQLFTLNQNGGWLPELNILFLVSSMAIYLMGAGRYSIDAKLKRQF